MENLKCNEMLLVSLQRNGQFYIRSFMLNMNIQIILKKSSSGLSTLFHLIDLDLLCCISKLIRALGT